MLVNSPFSARLVAPGQQSGFTLIEIMVALLVITIALAAVINTTTSSVDTGSYLRDKNMALWVAENYINELVIEKKWPDKGAGREQVIMNKRNWTIRTRVIQTANVNMRKLIVDVFSNAKESQALITLTAFISRTDSSRTIKLR